MTLAVLHQQARISSLVKFCPHCGHALPLAEASFCPECGYNLSQLKAAPAPATTSAPAVIRERIPETSRLSHVGVEKYLARGERVLFSSSGLVHTDMGDFDGYVTSRRVLLYRREGRLLGLIKEDRVEEILIPGIKRLSLIERGLLRKQMLLIIDDMEFDGSRVYMLDMYRAIQSARGV